MSMKFTFWVNQEGWILSSCMNTEECLQELSRERINLIYSSGNIVDQYHSVRVNTSTNTEGRWGIYITDWRIMP